MAKDYFQDIVPPGESNNRPRRQAAPAMSESESAPEIVAEETSDDTLPPITPERSIRNIHIQPSRPRRPIDIPVPSSERAPRRRRKLWLWILAIVAILAVAVLALVALRPTRITVTPRTHAVVFDNANQYTAYPAESATAGTLPYTVKTFELEDSETVASTGTVRSEDKASGQVTVFNTYSAAPVKLIKNTRFSTPEGHIFRAPADIIVPGKSGSTPGKITVTVIADAAGAEYNVGPFSRLTLPGLRSTPDMYTNVYAQSVSPFTGGFMGDKPGVSEADTERARAAMRNRLEEKARDGVAALQIDGDVVFADLLRITYETLPATPESDGMVRAHEKAHVSVPVFPANAFAQAVALSVSADAANSSIVMVPGAGYGASLSVSSSTLGVDPIQFALIGKATILWQIDTAGLAAALAGRDQSAFQTIVTTFPAIQEARARIQPFWSSSFPGDADKIKVTVTDPTR